MQLRVLVNIKNAITIVNLFIFVLLTLTCVLSYEFILYNYYYSNLNILNNINLFGLSLFVTGVWVGLIILFISDVRTFFFKFCSLIFFFFFNINLFFYYWN